MFKTLRGARLNGKRVLVRFDYNIPLKNRKVVDDERLRASLPTLKYLLKHNCRIIIGSHLGRPRGKIVEGLRLDPVARRLSKLLGIKVLKLNAVVGSNVETAVSQMGPRDIIMLENVQFNPGECANDAAYGKRLADLADIFVLDAFGQAHRNYASLTRVQKFIPSYAGFVLEKEVKVLSSLLQNPRKPFVAVLGGAKVSDKVKVIKNLLKKVDKLIISGAMAFTFLKAKGYEVGNSKVEDDFWLISYK